LPGSCRMNNKSASTLDRDIWDMIPKNPVLY
jgi:hypothetical protein